MKTKISACLILIFCCGRLNAQLPADDPLANSRVIYDGGGDELIIWDTH